MKIERLLVVWSGLVMLGACAMSEDDVEVPAPEVEVPDPGSEDAALLRVAGTANLDVVPFVAPAVTAPNVEAEVPLEERSRAELADALRPVILKGDGKLYIARSPNWAAVDAAFPHAGDGIDGDNAAAAPPIGSGDRPPETRLTAAVIGADGRHVVTSTTVAPYRNIARVLIGFDDGGWAGCTGSYIGPWTFVFAGHCVRQANGSVARRVIFEPGRQGGSLPFGSFDCRNDDTSTSNNFLLAIPSAYASSADSNFDYAVVDTFPCHRAPHWFGEPATNQGIVVNSGTATYNHYGYPGPACPGAPSGGTYQCGMSGPAYVNGSWIETEHIDSDHGQSGGPWFVNGRVAGTLIGYREYFDFFRCGFDVCRRTFARRIDSSYASFLGAIAYDY